MTDKYIDKIISGDCLEIMKGIPSNTVDVSFIDPPFNLVKQYTKYKDNRDTADYLDWSKKWILEMIRITKPSGSIFIHNIPKWLMEYYRLILNEKEAAIKEGDKNPYFEHLKKLKIIDWIVWNEAGSPKGRYLYASHYGILHFAKDGKTKFHNVRVPHKFCKTCGALLKDYGGKKSQINEFGTILSDVWDDIHRYKHAKRRDFHPNQLPEPLLERLLLMTANEGDLVMDPMIGVGTTAIAAKKLGMHYIGMDIDQNYCEIAREKLAKVQETKINGVYVSLFLGKIMTIRNKDIPAVLEATEKKTIRINDHGLKIISNGELIKSHKHRVVKHIQSQKILKDEELTYA